MGCVGSKGDNSTHSLSRYSVHVSGQLEVPADRFIAGTHRMGVTAGLDALHKTRVTASAGRRPLIRRAYGTQLCRLS